jgi:tail tube protein
VPVAVPGNTGTLSIGKQTAKGTPQATFAYKLRYTGGFGPAPDRNIIQLAETDSQRVGSNSVVVGSTVTGGTEHYLRPDEFGLLAYLALGTNADGGTNPNYTHTATANATGAAPYATLKKAVNGTVLVDQYSDCRIGALTVNGGAGQALTCSLTWGGLTALLGSTDAATAAIVQAPLTYPQVTVTLGGSAPGTVESFSLAINNNANFFQGDTGLSATDYVFGRTDVSGSLTMLFENDQKYRAFHTGSTSGTVPGATIYAESLVIACVVNANLSITFTITNIEYQAYAPGLNTDGTAIRAAADFRAQRGAAVSDYLSVLTKNAVATY